MFSGNGKRVHPASFRDFVTYCETRGQGDLETRRGVRGEAGGMRRGHAPIGGIGGTHQ